MKKLTEQNKRTNDKYFKCFTDMYSRPEFDAVGMRKAHNVSAILVTILADFGYLVKLSTATYSWKKSMGQPTRDLADTIRKEATTRWHASQHKRRKRQIKGFEGRVYNSYQEGYEQGRTEGESWGKRQVKATVDNITPEMLVETAKADGYAEGYRHGKKEGYESGKKESGIDMLSELSDQYQSGLEDGEKEERERHSDIIRMIKNMVAYAERMKWGTWVGEAKEALKKADYLEGKEEQK